MDYIEIMLLLYFKYFFFLYLYKKIKVNKKRGYAFINIYLECTTTNMRSTYV